MTRFLRAMAGQRLARQIAEFRHAMVAYVTCAAPPPAAAGQIRATRRGMHEGNAAASWLRDVACRGGFSRAPFGAICCPGAIAWRHRSDDQTGRRCRLLVGTACGPNRPCVMAWVCMLIEKSNMDDGKVVYFEFIF